MLKTELKLPFTFYNALNKQHRYRLQNPSKVPYPLISKSESLLPFEIRVPLGSTVSGFALYDLSNALVTNLSGNISRIETFSDPYYTWFIYKGAALSAPMAPNCYWVRIAAGSTVYYSEVFKVVPNENFANYVELRWKSFCNIGPIIYETGFENTVYIGDPDGAFKSYIEAIEPEFQEGGDENGAGEFIPTLQRLVCKQKIEAIAPDYLLDAFSFMQMHDQIVVSDYTDANVPIKRVKVSNNYGDSYLGTTKIEFEFGDDYIKTGCCTPPEIVACVPASFAGTIALPDAVLGQPYSFTITLAGTAPFAYTNVVKPGWMFIGISGNTITFSGTPTTAGTNLQVSFTITNCTNDTLPFSDTINVACSPVIIPNVTLPDAIINVAYNFSLTLDGTPPFTLNTIVKPSWMTVTGPTGSARVVTFTGTPTAAAAPASVSFNVTNPCGTNSFSSTVEVKDSWACDDTLSGSWADVSDHDYGFFPLNIGNNIGWVTFTYDAGNRPNLFTVHDDLDGSNPVNSGWVGVADYPGRWPTPTLNTPLTGTFSFYRTWDHTYSLRVEGGNGNVAALVDDTWQISFACEVAPSVISFDFGPGGDFGDYTVATITLDGPVGIETKIQISYVRVHDGFDLLQSMIVTIPAGETTGTGQNWNPDHDFVNGECIVKALTGTINWITEGFGC